MSAKSVERLTWYWIKYRCYNPKNYSYADYGGRGIVVCERWLRSYEDFLSDMGPRPGDDYSIDRINVNGNYEPGNCRWATRKQQASNRRTTRLFTHDGVTASLTDWARQLGVDPVTLYERIGQMPFELALKTPRLRAPNKRPRVCKPPILSAQRTLTAAEAMQIASDKSCVKGAINAAARKYGVSRKVVSRIWSGERWGSVTQLERT